MLGSKIGHSSISITIRKNWFLLFNLKKKLLKNSHLQKKKQNKSLKKIDLILIFFFFLVCCSYWYLTIFNKKANLIKVTKKKLILLKKLIFHGPPKFFRFYLFKKFCRKHSITTKLQYLSGSSNLMTPIVNYYYKYIFLL